MLDNEKQIRKDERERVLTERVPALQLSGLSLQDLQVHLSLKHFNPHKKFLLVFALKEVNIKSHNCLNIFKGSLHPNHFFPPTPSRI